MIHPREREVRRGRTATNALLSLGEATLPLVSLRLEASGGGHAASASRYIESKSNAMRPVIICSFDSKIAQSNKNSFGV